MPQTIKLSLIRIDGGTQPRAALNEAVVAEYAEALTADISLPPVAVFFDGSAHWLADGFHRYHAHRKAGLQSIPADVHAGTKRDAVLYSVGANSSHGLRRSNEDKRRAVLTLLADDEWKTWSDRTIALACGVSVSFVGAVRSPVVAERQKENRKASEVRSVVGLHPEPTPASRPEPAAVVQIAAVRQASNDVEKPEAAPAKAARPAAAIDLHAELDAMRERAEEAEQNAQELADLLESYAACEPSLETAAKELAKEKAIRRTVETQRDRLMVTCNELRAEVKNRDRQIKALQRKAAA